MATKILTSLVSMAFLFSPVSLPAAPAKSLADLCNQVSGSDEWAIYCLQQIETEAEDSGEYFERGNMPAGSGEEAVFEPADVVQTYYVWRIVCERLSSGSIDLECTRLSMNRCPEGERRYRLHYYTSEDPAQIRTETTACLSDAEASDPPGEPSSNAIIVTNQEFRSLAIPASELVMQQPVEGHPYYAMSLVGERTNQWAESSEHVIETTILGTPVEVRATPLEYRWDYGNGVTQTTAGPGGRRPDNADPYTYPAAADVVYEETGNYEVNLTTVYTGEFRYGDSGWIPISGVAEVASEPKMNTVWKIKTRLVDEGCDTNPDGWACGDDVWQTTPPWMEE